MKKLITLVFCLLSVVVVAQQEEVQHTRKDSISFAEKYLSQAELHQRNEDLSKAIEYYLKAKEVLGTTEYSPLYVRACIGLGNIYNDVYDTYEAVNHFKEGINHQLVFNNIEPIPQMYIRDGIGRTIINEGIYDNAEEIIRLSVIMSQSHNDTIFAIESLNNLVYTLGIQNKKSEAESFFTNLEKLIEGKQLPEALSKSIDVSKFVIGRSPRKDSLKYLKAPNLAKERFLRALYKIEYDNANKDKIVKSYERWNAFRDSIRTDFYKTFTDSLQVRQQKRSADEELSRLQIQEQIDQNEIDTKNRNILYLIAILTVLTLSSFILFYFFRKNKKQKEIIENLQKELHHRVKNNLSIIDTFIEVAKEEFADQRFSNKLGELQNRIDSINTVHLQLYKSDDITNVNIKKYVDTLSQNVQQSFSESTIEIENNIDDSLMLDPTQSFPIGLIINEFLTNSFKYAFDNKQGNIKITISEQQSNIALTLSDNGKGLPKNFDIDTIESFGIRIMKLLSQQLDGSFDLKTNNGVSLNVQFPK